MSTPVTVTPETYIRAETDRTFANIARLAGGVNRFFYYRSFPPLDQQAVVRMNRDTLYAGAVVDTSRGATITVPPMPKDRYFSVLLLDNDHYCPGVIYEPGRHPLPTDTKYLFLVIRIQVLRPSDPADIALVNALQDRFVIEAGSADPFDPPAWDAASRDALTEKYNAEFAAYDRYPDGFMGPRGVADYSIRHLAAAGAWGLFPNRDALYINHNPRLPAEGCYEGRFEVPDNKGFWSITVYGEDGYIKSERSILNATNTVFEDDGTFIARFGSAASCGDVPNRLDAPEGWNFLMRIYRPGPSALDGTYKLPKLTKLPRPL